MEIFGHLVKNDSIAGIGPLLIEDHPDSSEVMNNGSCRYSFDLYAAGMIIKIASPWFKGNVNDVDVRKIRAWREQYYIYHKAISELLDNPDTSLISNISLQ